MAGAFWTIDAIRTELEALDLHAGYQPANFYKDFTRRLKEILGGFQVLKGDGTLRTVDIIYANPERAIAKITETKNTLLPILSLQFEGVELDTTRRKPAAAIVEKKFWDSDKQRAIRYIALAPPAANLSFGVNVWGKYVDEVNQLTEQILLLFRPNLNIDIHPHESYEAFVLDVGDAANLTAGDREDRVVRRTVRFKVESYIPGNVFRFTNTSEMKTLNFEQYIEETSGFQTLESFYAGGGAAFALNQLDNRGGGFATVPTAQQIPTFTTQATPVTIATTTQTLATTTATQSTTLATLATTTLATQATTTTQSTLATTLATTTTQATQSTLATTTATIATTLGTNTTTQATQSTTP